MSKYALCVGKSQSSHLEEGTVIDLERTVDDEMELIKDGKVVAKARILVNDAELALLITEVFEEGKR